MDTIGSRSDCPRGPPRRSISLAEGSGYSCRPCGQAAVTTTNYSHISRDVARGRRPKRLKIAAQPALQEFASRREHGSPAYLRSRIVGRAPSSARTNSHFTSGPRFTPAYARFLLCATCVRHRCAGDNCLSSPLFLPSASRPAGAQKSCSPKRFEEPRSCSTASTASTR